MSNMSYCRFNNTAIDLEDCIDTLNEGVESKEEARKRKRLLQLCQDFIDAVESDSNLREDVENCVLRNEDGDLLDEDGNEIEKEEEEG
jgi:hypothetical protein